MEKIEKIKVFGNYFKEFYIAQKNEVKDKIDYILTLIKSVEKVPRTYLRQIDGVPELYEIRVQYVEKVYRIFCCPDKECLVILFDDSQKEMQKTPVDEIEKAKAIMKEYFETQKR